MTGIQLVLLTGVFFISFYLIVRWKKRSLDVVLFSLLILAAVLFILRPNLTQSLANKLGVGRGADLVFYTSILIFWFVIIKLYARMRNMEQKITDLVRKNAIEKAEDHSSS